jgi:hypothetical protein
MNLYFRVYRSALLAVTLLAQVKNAWAVALSTPSLMDPLAQRNQSSQLDVTADCASASAVWDASLIVIHRKSLGYTQNVSPLGCGECLDCVHRQWAGRTGNLSWANAA